MTPRRLKIAESCAGIVLALAITAPAAAAAPRIYVSPDPVRPGGKAVVQGAGFCNKASCGRVTVFFAGRKVGSARVDRRGRFRLAFGALGSPGSYRVLARQGKRTARSTLHIQTGGS